MSTGRRGVVALAASGLLLAGVAGTAEAAERRAEVPTATCAEMHEQLWSFKATQVVAECHARRAARAAERATLLVGKVSSPVAAQWARTMPNAAGEFAKKAAGTQDVQQAAGFAHKASANAAVLSGAVQPVMSMYGVGKLASTKDAGYTGAELAARQAARHAWKTADKAANTGRGQNMSLNIDADRAEVQAWRTARAAGWIK